MARRTPAAAALLLAAAMGTTTGCGSEPESTSTPRVATLASAAAPSSAPSPAAPKRPRERLDGTSEDWEVMVKPYEDCLVEQGISAKGQPLGGKSNGGPAIQPGGIDEKKYEAADAVCRPKYYPLPPWEYDPANPEAKDFARDVVACLKRKGVKYVEVNPDGQGFAFGGEQNHAPSISRGLEYAPVCEREVAAKQ
jgi:hypothetical protein